MKISENRHHKNIDKDRNFILRFYYSNYIFFGMCCVGTEFYYLYLYYSYYSNTENSISIIFTICCILKNIVNVFRLIDSVSISLKD
jgi:hypothetical protein